MIGRGGESVDPEFYYARLALELLHITPDALMKESYGSYMVICSTIDLMLEDERTRAKAINKNRRRR